MKHTFRDLIIALIGYSGIAWVYRWYMRRKGPLVRVLCFHDVPDVMWFRSILKLMSDEFTLITPEQFHAKQFNAKKINILLTFDDGYQSWVDVCLPVLDEFGAKGIFFINSGLLNVAHNSTATARYIREQLLLTHSCQLLTWEGAEKLVGAAHTVGGHTVSHVRASEVLPDVWRNEVHSDKIALQSRLGVTLTDFAFPFGREQDISVSAQEIVTENGYHIAYSAETGFCSSHGILVPRTLLTPQQSVEQVHRWVLGGYDVLKGVMR